MRALESAVRQHDVEAVIAGYPEISVGERLLSCRCKTGIACRNVIQGMSRATTMTAAKIKAADDLLDEFTLFDIEATRNQYVASMRHRAETARCLAAREDSRELLA